MNRPPLRLFEGFGIELEYMIVRADDLAVLPSSDAVLEAVAGEIVSEIEVEELAWSNELVMHVIELKTNGPAAALEPLPAFFQRDVSRINRILAPAGGRLMPTAMHPWMDPFRETVIWPHEYSAVYEAYDRIFDCRGHGWSNLQSMHINLPFADDAEFGRLHAAIRLVLPLLPALAASSPVVEGRVTGMMDSRLDAYRRNQARIPSLTGQVVPEPVFSRGEYEGTLLGGLYRDIEPHDPEGILRYEFLNSRGAIARFDRGAIEIRVLDLQECPKADLAVAALIVAVLRALASERWSSSSRQMEAATGPLAALLRSAIVDAERTMVEDPGFLALFGLHGIAPCPMGEVWRRLAGELGVMEGSWREPLETILGEGPLARRIVAATGPEPSRERLREVYRELCDCLDRGAMFPAR